MPITTDVVSSYPVSSMSCWIGRVFEEEWWGAVTSPEMTSPEVVSPDATGNNVIGSDRKLHHRKSPEMTYREWRNGKCKGDNSARLFSHRVFPAFFSSETPRGQLGNFWEFPHRAFHFSHLHIGQWKPWEFDQWNATIPLSISQPRFSLYVQWERLYHLFLAIRWIPFFCPIKFKC